MAEDIYPKVTLNNDEVLMLKDSSGNNVELVEYDGYCLARRAIENGDIPDSRTNIPNIIKMKVRTDDVFLVAYPKAGTHWTSEIMHMLLHGKIEYNAEPQINSMLPFQAPERMDQLPSPRIINSHMYFRHLPRDILNKRNKIVFVNRNPKDVAVSYYYHCQQVSLKFQGSWNDFLDLFLLDQVHMYHCPWHVYMLDWERFMLEHTELDVLIVNYEDLSKNATKEIERIAEFLDVKNTAEFYNKVAEKCSFKQLKQDYVKRDKGGVLFRKGGVGGWKDWFTVSQNERFDKFLKDKMKDSTWKFIYEL